GDPAQRLAEDRLRVLRAIRFATVLEYEIESETWNALQQASASITEISAERIRDELVRIFLSPQRLRGWDLLDRSGLLRAILPEIEPMKGCAQPPQFHPEGDVFQHTRLMLELLPENVSVPLVFSVILHDVAKLKRFMARPTFEAELELHRVDCASSHAMLDNYEFLQRKKEEFANEPIIPPPLVTGNDLIGLGMKPGPRFGEILEAVETRQLEGALKTREEALDWVKREYG